MVPAPGIGDSLIFMKMERQLQIRGVEVIPGKIILSV
jgi:hypothetical protein